MAAGVSERMCHCRVSILIQQAGNVKTILSAGCILAAGVLAAALPAPGCAPRREQRISQIRGGSTPPISIRPAALRRFLPVRHGGWMKSNPIPPEYSSWGTFTQLADKNQQNLRQILDDA